MALLYKPSKEAITDWGPSLTEPEHEAELTPQAIIRKLQSGLVPQPGSLLFGYENASASYIQRKQELLYLRSETEKAFNELKQKLTDKKVKYKIPKTFDEFVKNQNEFSQFATKFLENPQFENPDIPATPMAPSDSPSNQPPKT